MVWYAAHWVAPAQFVPAALVGALSPWSGLRAAAHAHPHGAGAYMAAQLTGSGITTR